MKTTLAFFIIIPPVYAHATNKIVLGRAAQGWNNAANFLPSGVPANGDTVTIPLGFTISVKGAIYTTLPTITVFVYGTLDFDPSGKLNLGNASTIQLFTLGRITSNGTSSELIKIGGVVKYNGQNDGTVTGPKFASAVTAWSVVGTSGGGFIIGILPVKLRSFSLQVKNDRVILNWILFPDPAEDQYIIQKAVNNSWLDLKTFSPPGSGPFSEAAFSYTDISPSEGKNLYRLMFINHQGQTLYSNVLVADVGKSAGTLSLYPNPVRNEAVLNWNKTIDTGTILVLNSAGAKVFERQVENPSNAINIDFSSLKNGLYYLVLTTNDGAIKKISFVKFH